MRPLSLLHSLLTIHFALDPVVVGAPAYDGFFDLLGGEVFADGAAGEVGELGVGGEAEGDVLLDGEGVELDEFAGGDEGGEAELFFEADDAVLDLEGVHAREAERQQECHGHEDGPGSAVGVVVAVTPVPDGGGDDVEQEDRHQEEVEGRVPAGVVLVGLGGGHGEVLGVGEFWFVRRDDDSPAQPQRRG